MSDDLDYEGEDEFGDLFPDFEPGDIALFVDEDPPLPVVILRSLRQGMSYRVKLFKIKAPSFRVDGSDLMFLEADILNQAIQDVEAHILHLEGLKAEYEELKGHCPDPPEDASEYKQSEEPDADGEDYEDLGDYDDFG